MGLHNVYVVAVLLLLIEDFRFAVVTTEEVCDGETFRGQCSIGSVLVIQTAWLGQLKLGECISRDLGFLGCGKDALGELDSRCSGRHTCDVLIDRQNNPDIYEGNTCYKEITSYLDVDYTCVEGRHMVRTLQRTKLICSNRRGMYQYRPQLN